jgi:hypothetical protein
MSDLDGYCFVKRNGALVPRDFHADGFMATIKEGREIMVTARRPRNPAHHRLLWAMLRKVVENSDQWPNETALLDELKLATGLAEVRVNLLTGKPYAIPGSISYASMDQTKFKEWFDQATHLLATRVLQCAPQELIDEVVAMCAETRRSV